MQMIVNLFELKSLREIILLLQVFLVLRKKDSHVTFLHVFHHVSMVVLTWFILTYSKGVSVAYRVVINPQKL